MKISIIIPIYKVEQYLNQCVDSVLSQTYKNLEVILVDDGSPDGCPAICDEYAIKDNRVKVIHKENGGLSDARNAGLKVATGDYVIFLDSDDYYNNECFIQDVVDALSSNPTDILCHQRQKFVEGQDDLKYPVPYSDDEINEKDFGRLIYKLSSADCLDASACMKVINREFLLHNELYFKSGMYSEDVEWFLRVLSVTNSMSLTNSITYCYRVRHTSISHSIGLKNIQDLFFSIEKYSELYKSLADKSLKRGILNYLAYQYFITMGLTGYKLKGEDRKMMMSRLSNYSWVVDYAISRKTIRCAKLMRYLGLRKTVCILGYYIKHK